MFYIKTRQVMNDFPQPPKSALQSNKQYLAADFFAEFVFFAYIAY